MTEEEKKKRKLAETKSLFDRLRDYNPFKPSAEPVEEEINSIEQKVDRQGNVIIIKKKKKTP